LKVPATSLAVAEEDEIDEPVASYHERVEIQNGIQLTGTGVSFPGKRSCSGKQEEAPSRTQ